MLTFRQFLSETNGVKTAAAIALAAKIANVNRQTQQDRSASAAEKTISNELFWLASLVALGMVTGEKQK